MAQRRVARRGRTIAALILGAFVLIASSVIWRRSVGIAQAREIRELEVQRVQLEGERARLARDLREASSRSRLGAVAEQRLGMRVPADWQVVILRRTEREGR